MSTPRQTRCGSRASVLLAVLLVVAIGAMIGTSVMYFGQAEAAGASHALRAAQGRAAAWSGVQAVMAELLRQRDDMLRGKRGEPEVSEQGVVHQDRDGAAGRGGGGRLVYRVVANRRGERVESESAKLDVGSATAEMLAKVPGISAELAGRIVAARESGGGRMQSTLDLLAVEGVSPSMLRGGAEEAPRETLKDRGSAASPAAVGLAELLTVFSFDPNVQAGLDAAGLMTNERTGRARVSLATGSGDQLRRSLDGRVPEDVIEQLIVGREAQGESSAPDLVRALRGSPPDRWSAALDAVAPTEDECALGRLDLNRASVEALACIPGIDAATAQKIGEVRDRLDDSRRATIAWPVLEGVLNADEFQMAAAYLSIRSLQWRVTVEGGWLDDSGAAAGTPRGPLDEADRPLTDRAVLEAVIDLSGFRPRVAYLRDVTLRPIAATLAAAAVDREAARPGSPSARPAPLPPPATPPSSDYRPPEPARADEERSSSQPPAATDGGSNHGGGGLGGGGRPKGPGRIGRWTTGL